MNAEERQTLRRLGIDEKEIERLDDMLTNAAKPDLTMIVLTSMFFLCCIIWCATVGAR